MFGEFLQRFPAPGRKDIYIPDPTWGNHWTIFKDAGLEGKKYTYYKPETRGLDFEGLMRSIDQAPNGSFFLLHACAHNPTGVDPTVEQWKQISQAFKAKKHFAFFDMAYQGFASGDFERDAAAIKIFLDDGHQFALGQVRESMRVWCRTACVACAECAVPVVLLFCACRNMLRTRCPLQSYAKNMGLYGQRGGVLSVVCQDADEAQRVESQLKLIGRAMFSNPPLHAAMIIDKVLNDSALRQEWYGEVKKMAHRIIGEGHDAMC